MTLRMDSLTRVVKGELDGEEGFLIPLADLEQALDIPEEFVMADLKVVGDELEIHLARKADLKEHDGVYTLNKQRHFVYRSKENLLSLLPERVEPFDVTFILFPSEAPIRFQRGDELIALRKHKHIAAWVFKDKSYELNLKLS